MSTAREALSVLNALVAEWEQIATARLQNLVKSLPQKALGCCGSVLMEWGGSGGQRGEGFNASNCK